MKKSNVLSLSIILFILLLPFSKITAQRPFITKWKATTNKQLTIPTTGGGYNYSIKWYDDASPLLLVGSATSQTGSYTKNGLISTHIYRIEITGSFPRIWFNYGGDKQKITSIEQWGDIVWSSMEKAFMGCNFLQGNATDSPNLSIVTNMSAMFYEAKIFNRTSTIGI